MTIYYTIQYKMEKRLNKKAEHYITTFKNDIKEKVSSMSIENTEEINKIIQFVYDYDRLIFTKEDFQKRKRIKNFVPMFDRCCAKRANEERCTRRKKESYEYCGTHLKGTPNGIIEEQGESKTTQKVEVYAQDIQGIIYYIDKNNNVYQIEDIIKNKTNPKIIAKYVKDGENYSIPEFI
jgi:hypothetical protein